VHPAHCAQLRDIFSEKPRVPRYFPRSNSVFRIRLQATINRANVTSGLEALEIFYGNVFPFGNSVCAKTWQYRRSSADRAIVSIHAPRSISVKVRTLHVTSAYSEANGHSYAFDLSDRLSVRFYPSLSLCPRCRSCLIIFLFSHLILHSFIQSCIYVRTNGEINCTHHKAAYALYAMHTLIIYRNCR